MANKKGKTPINPAGEDNNGLVGKGGPVGPQGIEGSAQYLPQQPEEHPSGLLPEEVPGKGAEEPQEEPSPQQPSKPAGAVPKPQEQVKEPEKEEEAQKEEEIPEEEKEPEEGVEVVQPKGAQPSAPRVIQAPVAQQEEHARMQPPWKIIGGAAALIIILAIIYAVASGHQAAGTSSTTTIGPKAFSISSCMTITAPGVYNLTGNIASSSQSAPCIKVASSNVKLNGEGYSLIGSGPFTSQNPPYSYGIMLDSVSNVTVTRLGISKFSYGIYLNNTRKSNISYIVMHNMTIAGVYFARSLDNRLSYSNITSVNGQGGAVSIVGGGNNTVSYTSLLDNSYYGIVVNSTGNRIANDTMVGNPVDLACNPSTGYTSYNRFENTTCYVNNYCNFASCTSQNLQATPESTVLQQQVNTCGTINYAGTYSLSSNINVPNFLNVKLSPNTPCIIVNASNVNLNCNGHSIDNGAYGVFAANAYNVTVSDCSFDNNTYAMYFASVLKLGLHTITANNGTYGAYIMGSTDDNFTNLKAAGNKYGVYINGTTYAVLTRFSTLNNSYGIAMDNSTSITLNSGTALHNSKADIYCSVNTYNSTLSTMSGTTCGSTDCVWATSCPIHYLPNLTTYPISACTTISVPGQYIVNANLVAKGNCFDITASNVSLECANHAINGVGTGTAIMANNVSDVSLFDCKILGFNTGIESSNSKYLIVQNMQFSSLESGISLSGASSAMVSNNIVTGFSGTGYLFSGTGSSTITEDTAKGGAGTSVFGFRFSRALNNTVVNNTALDNVGYGFSFQNGTQSNFVKNNTANGNRQADFACYSGSSAPDANLGVVNYGNTKENCRWMAVIPSAQQQVQCMLITSPQTVSIGYDMMYTFGSSCFNVYTRNATQSARNSVINCNGHTIYATHGGTFVSVYNTSGVTIENCVLNGFTNPINVTAPVAQTSIKLINNTILNSQTAIYAVNAINSQISKNNITNTATGIYAYYANGTTIENNLISEATSNGMVVGSSASVTLRNNTVGSKEGGTYLVNMTASSLQDNNLKDTVSGALCSGTSVATGSGNVDLGGNSCPATSCQWLTC